MGREHGEVRFHFSDMFLGPVFHDGAKNLRFQGFVSRRTEDLVDVGQERRPQGPEELGQRNSNWPVGLAYPLQNIRQNRFDRWIPASDKRINGGQVILVGRQKLTQLPTHISRLKVVSHSRWERPRQYGCQILSRKTCLTWL